MMTNSKRSNTMLGYFPAFKTEDAIFSKMTVLGAPWDETVGHDMDTAYFTYYSGIKAPSLFVRLNSKEGKVNSSLISSMLWNLHKTSWTRLWDAMLTEYTPIDNYNILEKTTLSRTEDRNIDKTGDLTSTVDKTGTETRNLKSVGDSSSSNQVDTTGTDDTTNTLTHGEVIDKTAQADSFTYGFNSPEEVPTARQTETGADTHSGQDVTVTNTDTTSRAKGSDSTNSSQTDTGTVDTVGKDVRADKTIEATTDNAETTETVDRSRIGNVGQNSYQELIKQEFELWKWNFYLQVFSDVDRILTLAIADPCEIEKIQGIFENSFQSTGV